VRPKVTSLARKLRVFDYFSLAFGTIVGAGWVVVMDDWLGRGGPLGAILGFLLGALILLPVGYVYGQWVRRLPDAAGEAAYAAQVFPPLVSYFTGWVMLLAYFIVCPWEAVAVGKIAAYIFPALNSLELYRIGGQPIFLPRLALGILLTVFLGALNYRGIRLSANFQKLSMSLLLLLFAAAVGISVTHGAPANFHPLFHATPVLSILLILQIVPYFFTGFESIAKSAEEANPEFRGGSYWHAIALALCVAALFYALAVAAVAYIAPWQGLIGLRFVTAAAFQQALGARWPVSLILACAFFGLFQCFNGNLIAATRLLFAMGRNGGVTPRLGTVHPKFQTPSTAVWAICAGTIGAQFFGDAILVPVTEVGSAAAAFGWFSACLSFFIVEPRLRLRLVTALGGLAALALLLMKFVPIFPGHFSLAEWIALAVWLMVGLMLRARR
jgi:basic amino acid/polyamine antiporter, APA family